MDCGCTIKNKMATDDFLTGARNGKHMKTDSLDCLTFLGEEKKTQKVWNRETVEKGEETEPENEIKQI